MNSLNAPFWAFLRRTAGITSRFFPLMKMVMTRTARSICTAISTTARRKSPDLRIFWTMLSSNSPQMHSTTGWKNRTSGTSIWTSLTSLFRAVPRQSGKEIPPFRFLFLHNRSSAAPSHGSSPHRRAAFPPLSLSLFLPFYTVSCPRSPQ